MFWQQKLDVKVKVDHFGVPIAVNQTKPKHYKLFLSRVRKLKYSEMLNWFLVGINLIITVVGHVYLESQALTKHTQKNSLYTHTHNKLTEIHVNCRSLYFHW
jgi:hypothetical protein